MVKRQSELTGILQKPNAGDQNYYKSFSTSN